MNTTLEKNIDDTINLINPNLTANDKDSIKLAVKLSRTRFKGWLRIYLFLLGCGCMAALPILEVIIFVLFVL